MTSLPPLMVAGTLAAATAFAFVLDLVKVPVFVRLGIAEPKPSAGQPKASDSKPDAKAEPKPEAKAKTPSDLTTQIAKRSYELYEEGGHQDGRAVQDWEKAEQEIRKAEPEVKPEAKPEASPEPKPEANPEPKPEAKVEPKPEASPEPKPEANPEPKPEAKAPSDLTPELVKRVHELYEALGRKDVQAVEELEKAERENRKDEHGK